MPNLTDHNLKVSDFGRILHHVNIPVLHHVNIPVLHHVNIPVLHHVNISSRQYPLSTSAYVAPA